MAELQEGLCDLSGINLRCMTDQQLAFNKDFITIHGRGLVPILVGYSRIILDRHEATS